MNDLRFFGHFGVTLLSQCVFVVVEDGRMADQHELNKADEEQPEPKPKWVKSRARKLLCADILEGRVPRKAKHSNGKFTKPKLKEICHSRPELQKCHCSKFSSGLGSLRATIDDKMKRKDLDQAAFDSCIGSHPVSLFSHKGHIQWQGSDAQELCWQHLEQNMHNTMKWHVWHGEHPEHCNDFPLAAFKDKV